MSQWRQLDFRLASLLLLAACSNGTEPGPESPLVVLPAVDTISAGSSIQFRAVQVGSAGDTVEVRRAVWSSRDPDVAAVSTTGLVTGARTGRVTIVALAGDLRGEAELRVERRFRALDVSTGSAGICAVDLERRIWCQGGWGAGLPFPSVDAEDIRTFSETVSGGEQYRNVGSNQFFACGLATSGQVSCWGYRVLGDSLSAGVPTPIAPELSFDTLSVHGWMACGLATGTAYCWGLFLDRVKPVDTGGIPLVRLELQADDGCGWTADGVELCWDDLGLAYPQDRTIVQPPTPGVPVLRGLVSGDDFFCGLGPDGLAWCWGANEQGQLGNGTAIDSADPVQVGGGRSFTLLSAAIDGSARRVCGIAEQNELYCWGDGFGSVPAAVLY